MVFAAKIESGNLHVWDESGQGIQVYSKDKIKKWEILREGHIRVWPFVFANQSAKLVCSRLNVVLTIEASPSVKEWLETIRKTKEAANGVVFKRRNSMTPKRDGLKTFVESLNNAHKVSAEEKSLGQRVRSASRGPEIPRERAYSTRRLVVRNPKALVNTGPQKTGKGSKKSFKQKLGIG